MEEGTAATCLNCGTGLAGHWCYACGQDAHGGHRSVVHLAHEFVEILTHADSRLWRTLRLLATRPASLTCDYLAGRRASQIPPLRLFFVVLFVLFGVGAIGTPVKLNGSDLGAHVSLGSSTGGDGLSRLHAAIAHADLGPDRMLAEWVRTRLQMAVDDPAALLSVVREWSERFAILMLPIAALLMALLTVGHRRFMLFDHFIFAAHSLSATGIVLVVRHLLGRLTGWDADWLLLALPVHLFAHMRGVYRLSVFGTLWRMAVLFNASAVAVTLLVASLAGLGLFSLGR